MKLLKVETVWNYECFRDFCGMFADRTDRNGRLVYNLPKAILEFAKMEGIEYNELTEMLVSDDLVDFRTGFNLRCIMEDFLTKGIKPTEAEIIAWLDVVYVDTLPTMVEIIAAKGTWV